MFKPRRFPSIICKDGFRMSVQASESHYCSPKANQGPYTCVEVGFPSMEVPDSWREYATRTDDNPSDIYAYIPLELVNETIEQHGGIDFIRFFNQK